MLPSGSRPPSTSPCASWAFCWCRPRWASSCCAIRIIGLILEHGKFTAADTTRTAWALLFLCLGLYVYAGRDTLTRVFYAYHDTRTPVKISVATVVINVGLSYLFMQFLGVGGLALGTTVALTINFVVLIWLLRRKIGPVGFGRTFSSLLRVAGVSAVMGAVVWTVDHFLSGAMPATTGGNAVRVVVGVVVGAGVFLLVSRLVKMPELAEITDMLRAVLKRTARRPAGQTPAGNEPAGGGSPSDRRNPADGVSR